MTYSGTSIPTGPSSGLRSERSSRLLNQIEKIRANGIGDVIDLPQLAVCGDQSAGKSSVLEGITGIPFPRQEGLCTRFPTEIIMRNSSATLRAVATIRPHKSRSPEASQTLRDYHREMKEDLSDLPVAIEDVSKLLGIRGNSGSADGMAFASDVLRIEVTGPTGLQLSIIDLPGLISVANEEQSEADIEAVYAMVKGYLSNTRTIILAVVQAGNDIANQGIIRIAREYDQEGQRTVGIITKPDLINEGAQQKLANIAKNRDSIKLKLGFFLLKNPSPAEAKVKGGKVSRSELEREFFNRPIWKAQDLDMSRVGVEMLTIFIQDLLDAHFEREMPKVRSEMRRFLTSTEQELKAMGPERRSIVEIRSFITDLSMQYFQLTLAALDGNYESTDAPFLQQKGSRLRAIIHQQNTIFSVDICERGHKRHVNDKEAKMKSRPSKLDNENGTAQLVVSKKDMVSWIHQIYLQSRGCELPGQFNHVLLSELFHEQSSPWREIAQFHVSAVVTLVANWVNKAIARLIHDERLRREIDAICQQQMEESRAKAFKELNKILADEARHPITYNCRYADEIQRTRKDVQKLSLTYALTESGPSDWSSVSLRQPADMERIVASLQLKMDISMNDQACEEALVALNAYYKVAMEAFVDNVCKQVIERHVLAPLPEIFYPPTVARFSDDQLLRIGSEPQHEIARRRRLNDYALGLRESLVEIKSISG